MCSSAALRALAKDMSKAQIAYVQTLRDLFQKSYEGGEICHPVLDELGKDIIEPMLMITGVTVGVSMAGDVNDGLNNAINTLRN